MVFECENFIDHDPTRVISTFPPWTIGNTALASFHHKRPSLPPYIYSMFFLSSTENNCQTFGEWVKGTLFDDPDISCI